MTPGVIAACLFLASIALATMAGHAVIAAADRAMRLAAWTRLGARTRAGLLVHARLAPATIALVFAPLVQLAFWCFEPAGKSESVGLVLPGLAVAGAALLAVVGRRAWRAAHATRRLAHAWRAVGEPQSLEGWHGPAWIVRTPFPVVAVVGVRRAELFVSADVMRACSRLELEAVAAHERAHVLGHDNLTRLLLALAPATVPSALRLERAWEATAEELADLHARAGGNGVTLARALTKVSRLVAGVAETPPLAVSAFIGDGSLETRVRRLLEPPRELGRPVQGPSLAFTSLLALVVVAWGLPAVYEAAELLVRLGR